MSSAPCWAPATWFLHFPRSGPPGELNASYLEQNKAQEETEPGSRARPHSLLATAIQRNRRPNRDGSHNHICGRMPGAEEASEGHLLHPLPPASVYTDGLLQKLRCQGRDACSLQDQKFCYVLKTQLSGWRDGQSCPTHLTTHLPSFPCAKEEVRCLQSRLW